MKYILLLWSVSLHVQTARILSVVEIWFIFVTALKATSLLGVCSNRKPHKQTPEKEKANSENISFKGAEAQQIGVLENVVLNFSWMLWL